MSDTELTVSLSLQVKVDLRELDFKGLAQAIREAVDAACGERLGPMVRAIERRAMAARPDRWVNRGQLTRRVQVSWETAPIRRTRVRDGLPLRLAQVRKQPFHARLRAALHRQLVYWLRLPRTSRASMWCTPRSVRPSVPPSLRGTVATWLAPPCVLPMDWDGCRPMEW